MTAACESCAFFDQKNTGASTKVGKDAGVCRFNPPVSQPTPDAHGLWPVVSGRDWCGHYASEKGDRR